MLTKLFKILVLLFIVSFQAKAEIKDTIVVARDGTGKYRNVQEAIESIRAYMDYTILIYVKNGTYKEKVIVPAWIKNVIIEGEDINNTIITYDDHANIDKMGTFRTHTLKIEGDNVTLKNITIENNAPQMGQAVALHTGGDKLKFIRCRFLGNQDTVFTGGERTRLYFQDCYIEGTTDFIFGAATVLFENCIIHSKRNSYITAASTVKEVEYGYVFKNCKLTAAEGITKVYLGRPWRPYGATLFMNCELGSHILPAGWHNWNNTENEKTARYAEYMNTGAGANVTDRVKWSKQLTRKEAEKVTIENIYKSVRIDNWNPKNDIF